MGTFGHLNSQAPADSATPHKFVGGVFPGGVIANLHVYHPRWVSITPTRWEKRSPRGRLLRKGKGSLPGVKDGQWMLIWWKDGFWAGRFGEIPDAKATHDAGIDHGK